MLRKTLCFAVCIGFIFFSLSCGKKEREVGKTQPKVAGGKKPELTEAKKAKLAERERIAKLIKEKREELNNTEWQINLTSLSGKSKRSKIDILTFTRRKVVSKEFKRKGYPASNYSLRIKGKKVIWETMQTKGKEEVISWHAEFRGNVMKGIISKNSRGKREDFSFISISSKKIEGEESR
jgi:hypothetical protein